MKTIFSRAIILFSAAILSLAGVNRSIGDEVPAAQLEKESTYEGTVTAIDPVEATIAVKGFWLSKKFNAAETCKVSLEDKPEATLKDLHPGQKVDVHYQNVQGVLVASRILQHNRVLTGCITAVDPARRTLVIKGPAGTKDLVAADDCSVILKDEKVGTLENLKIGHHVRVAYDPVGGVRTAHKILQSADSFVGTIQALDAITRTVRARNFLSEKKFILADDCRIIVEGNGEARLRDLRIGDRVEFSYEDANGILVASRIGRESESPPAQAAKLNNR